MKWAGHKDLFRLSHILRGFLGRSGVDIKPCSPLKPSHLGQLRHDLKMPMIVLRVHLWGGGRVNNIVIRRISEHLIHFLEGIGEDLSCLFILEKFHVLETGIMGFGKNPCFKWKSGGKGSEGEEGFVLGDDAMFLLELLSNDVTEDTPVFIIKIGLGSLDLFAHSFRDNREGDDLRMGMFQRGPCCDAVVFEDEDISKAMVTPQIDDPLTVGQQNILYAF
jgi:hypothetical protein